MLVDDLKVWRDETTRQFEVKTVRGCSNWKVYDHTGQQVGEELVEFGTWIAPSLGKYFFVREVGMLRQEVSLTFSEDGTVNYEAKV